MPRSDADLADARRRYAEELRYVANVKSEIVVGAFASLRRDRHEAEDSCWLHAPDFCLSGNRVP